MFNPAKASNQIRDKFVNYITSSYPLSNLDIRNQFRESLNSVVSKGPIIEVNDIFKFGKSINQLINENIICNEFRNIEKNKPDERLYEHKIPLDRPLYLHQEKAIRKVISGKSIVVSTGTGSGKTESFLIPILNELAKEHSDGTLNDGVRAILIYPMNALANDQLKRIREILLKYPYITFGVYNGSTEHNDKNAQGLYQAMFKNEILPELRNPLQNEILSREKLQEHPPHILFTNYAMLEHMLLRPNDGKVFTNSKFKFVVLDEAHVYYGATGMETSMLIRRLKARISYSKPPQFILTSATLGSSKESDKDVINFACNLTGENFDTDDIIRAERENFKIEDNLKDFLNEIFTDLCAENLSTRELLKQYKIDFIDTNEVNEIYYDLCKYSRLFNRLRYELRDPKELNELTKKLEVSEDLIISVMHIAAQGYKKGSALINIRYHFFLRALEGLFVSFYPKCEVSLIRRNTKIHEGISIPYFEVASCGDCGRIAIVGKHNKTLRKFENIRFDSIDDADYYYVNFEKDEDLFEDDDESIVENELKTFLCTKCGSIMESDEVSNPPCDCINSNKIEIIKTKSSHKCPACGVGRYNRFYLGNDAATSVIGSALYDELPEYNFVEPVVVENKNLSNPFDIFSEVTKKEKIVNKRQFLIFSDSRQEAAYFSSYLSNSYKQFIRRRAIFNIINNKDSSEFEIKSVVDQLSSLFSNVNNQSFAERLNSTESLSSISRRNAWIGILDELVNQNRSTSLNSLGYIYFEYKGNDDEKILNGIKTAYKVEDLNVKSFLNKLINDFIRYGAIDTSNIIELTEEDKEVIFFTPNQKYFVKSKEQKVDFKPSNHFIPSANSMTGKVYKTNRLELVKRALNINEEKAMEFLANYWTYLTNPNNVHRLNSNDSRNYTIDINSIRIVSNFYNSNPVYKCKKCGKITSFNINNNCRDLKCNGVIVPIKIDNEHQENHYVRLYSEEKYKPLIIKEHTAQLSKRESLDYQKEFVLKEINALSCSTTFEMGVDVGGLETVYLRNMPPLPSNYAQRAGRAGRSKLSAAYALTYSKLSSHDFNYFKDPLKMIKGTIYPPIFKNNNKKIIQRHINSVALSFFFSIYPEEYSGNKIENFLDNKGYLKLYDLLKDKPQELKTQLEESFPKELHELSGIENFSWVENLLGEDGTLSSAISNYEGTICELEKQKILAHKQNDARTAYQLGSLIYKYKDKQLIEFLAKSNVLPRYGFPVDTVELMQYMKSDKKDENELNLSRDLQLAISEYAPGSQVVADGKLFTSRYIRKVISKRKSYWKEGKIAICNDRNCGTVNFREFTLSAEDKKCSSCGKLIPTNQWRQTIEPRAGFITEEQVKPVPMTKPEKVYKTEEFYIGDLDSKHLSKKEVRFDDNSIIFESSENDKLLIKTTSDFYVCTECGYTLNENEIDAKNKQNGYKYDDKKQHKNANGYKCQNTSLSLFNIHHIFYTDVLKVTFSKDVENMDQARSILSALLDSISRILDIERSDIKGTIHRIINSQKISKYTFAIYDAVAGGVGYTRKLISGNDNEIADLVKKIILNAYYVTMNCECEPSCYLCLRNYGNQKYHDVLDRKKVYTFLEDYLNVDNLEILDIRKEEINDLENLFKLDNNDFSQDIKDWTDLNNYCSISNSEIFELLENNNFGFPDYCIGNIKILEDIKINIDAIWLKNNIIIPSDDKNIEYLENLIKNSSWKILKSKKEIEDLLNG